MKMQSWKQQFVKIINDEKLHNLTFFVIGNSLREQQQISNNRKVKTQRGSVEYRLTFVGIRLDRVYPVALIGKVTQEGTTPSVVTIHPSVRLTTFSCPVFTKRTRVLLQ
jgi:hypothetical protein